MTVNYGCNYIREVNSLVLLLHFALGRASPLNGDRSYCLKYETKQFRGNVYILGDDSWNDSAFAGPVTTPLSLSRPRSLSFTFFLVSGRTCSARVPHSVCDTRSTRSASIIRHFLPRANSCTPKIKVSANAKCRTSSPNPLGTEHFCGKQVHSYWKVNFARKLLSHGLSGH